MKPFSLIVFLFSIYSFNLVAQLYKPLPTDSATWGFLLNTPTGNSYVKETIKGDTLFAGNNYHKVYSQTNVLRGFYRESAKKIYAKIINYLDTSELIIYNFNLNVGDTFYDKRAANSPFTLFTYKYLLTSITTTTLTNDVRKQFNFSWVGQMGAPPSYTNLGMVCNFSWIEGLGSVKGIFNNRVFEEGTECFNAALISNASTAYLRCFEHKGIQRMTQTCLTLNTNEQSDNYTISLYPNPTINYLNIESNTLAFESYQIQLFNNLGQSILVKEIRESKTQIDLSALTQGMYFVKVYKNTEQKVFKLLKE